MSTLLLLVLAVPFVTAAVTLTVGHRSDPVAKAVSVGGSGLGLVLAWVVALSRLGDAAPLRIEPPDPLEIDLPTETR